MAKAMIRHLFPGNNSSKGFFSYFSYILPQAQTARFYCLKGGPGVGKSTFLRHIGDRMQKEGLSLEYLHCASDPESLDGLVIPSLGVALVDGTAPHVTDPVYPAAVDEIINLGDFWNADGIRTHRADIVHASSQIKRQYKRAYHYLAAAKCLMDDILGTVEAATDQAGVLLQAQGILDEELAAAPASGRLGKVRRLFASAITPAGVVHNIDSLTQGVDRVYLLENLWGAGVHDTLQKIADAATQRGLDAELFYAPLDPEKRLEHVVIPALKLAFLSEQDDFTLKSAPYATLDLVQFISLSQTTAQAHALAFSADCYHALIDQAVSTLAETKGVHDELEGYYIPYMNFTRVKEKEDAVCAEILALIKA